MPRRRPRARPTSRPGVFAAAAAMALLCTAQPGHAARVVLVGIDGGAWNLIDPMRTRGELPNLAALAERGTEARLATVEPVTSPVVWTSIATGRSPEAHGVTDFFSTRLDVRVPSVFERLAADGARVGLYDYLMTWPPRSLPGGFVIPSWLRRDETVTPGDVWQRVGLPAYRNEYQSLRTSDDYLARSRQDVSLKAPRWKGLSKAFDIEVGAVTFYAVDMTAHRFWHASFPEEFADPPAPGSEAEKSAVPDAMRGVDRAIGEIVVALEPEDSVLVVSDHGFVAAEDGARNVWISHAPEILAGSGLEPERQPFTHVSSFAALTYRIHPGDGSPEETRARDQLLEKLVSRLRSVQDGSGRSLFGSVEFVDVASRPPGLERPLLNRIRQWVVRRVLRFAFSVELKDNAHAVVFAMPDDGVLSEVWPDGEARIGGARGGDARGGKRTLAARELFSRQVFTGAHDPTAIFLAAGGPIAASPGRKDLSVLDLAPLVLYLAGRPIPADLEGRVPTEILRPEYLARHPVRQVAAEALPGLPDDDPTGAVADDPELVEKLRRLGYLE